MRIRRLVLFALLAGCKSETPAIVAPLRSALISSWNQLAPANSPAARFDHILVFDAAIGRAVLFGGLSNPSNALGDTWLFDGGGWHSVGAAGPGPRAKMAAAYMSNASNPTVLMTGGTNFVGALQKDTWRFNGANAWNLASPTAPTPPRDFSAMAWDPDDQVAVLFGGTADGGMNGLADTWLWDDTAATWTQVSTVGAPPARFNSRAVYDAQRKKVMLFGGYTGTMRLGDTWELDVPTLTWTQRMPAVSPPPRSGPVLAYDSLRGVSVLYGGWSGTASLGDTWEWDGTQWTLTSSSGPSARNSNAGTFFVNALQSFVFLFGGVDTAPFADSWAYLSFGSACSSGAQCDTGHCVDGVCCEQASCGTCQACNLPGSVGTCSAVTNAEDANSCAGANYCDVNGKCQPKQSAGGGCTIPIGCTTGFCVGGTCCTSACTGNACDSCANPTGICFLQTNGDAPGCTGINTCDASSTCLLKNGQSCSAGSSCASGFCADGYCCNTACNGGCDVCNSPRGTCTVVAQGTAGSPSCAPFVCDGAASACPLSCANDNACDKSHYCAGGACLARGANGNGCSAGDQCASAFCADATCCVSACTAVCSTCATANGSCASVTNADDPDTCTGTKTCDANGNCKLKNGQSCSAGSSCASGFCADGVCCNTACTASCSSCANASGNCSPVTSADDPDTCTGTKTCNAAGVCGLKTGQACTMAASCANGNCADGFCCNVPCNGGCGACNVTPGTCTLLAAGSTGSPSCSPYVCSGASGNCPLACSNDGGCAPGYYCTGNGLCAPERGLGQTCGTSDCAQPGCRECTSGFCVDGVCCNNACTAQCSVCSAALGASADGTCSNAPVGAPGRPSCAPYACSGTTSSCSTICTGDLNCAAGDYCAPGVGCVPQKANGASCNPAAGSDCVQNNCRECASGFCVGGTCCATACSSSCAGGSCKGGAPNGSACSANAACTSGFCIDGVCCATACTGACVVCNASGSAGTCTAAAAGTDPRSMCPGSGPCKATCSAAGGCAYPGPSTSCAPAACTGTATLQLASTCDGSGGCANRGTVDCRPFVCAAAACLSSCTDSTECAPPNACTAGSCGQQRNAGQSCKAASDCASGFCVDGVCCVSACGGKCARCDLPGPGGTLDGVCRAPVGQDPDGDCTGQGLCAGTCTAQSTCQFPGADRACDLCKACDGAGGCNQLPASGDDAACMTISCAMLSTECMRYQDLTNLRCVSPGKCAAPNDPARCTQKQPLPDGTACSAGMCSGGQCVAGSPSGMDGGSGGGGGGDGGSIDAAAGGSGAGGHSGCALAAPLPPSGALLLACLLLALAARRRSR